MKRIILTLLGTVAGLVSLLSFKTGSPMASGALPAATLPATGSTAAGSSAAAPAPSTSTASSATAGRAHAKAAVPATTSSSATQTAKTYTGSAVTTRYGVVQVEVTVAGSKITNVRFVQLTAFDRHSQEINSQAGPILLQETLTKQSAQVDTVSGATYTSDGYLQSLQSALDSAGIR